MLSNSMKYFKCRCFKLTYDGKYTIKKKGQITHQWRRAMSIKGGEYHYIKKEFKYNETQCKYRESLTNKKIPLVIAIGPSGTGKTAVACSLSLEQLVTERISKLVITRPTISTGNDLGFLPGTLENKMDPWVAPIYDNFMKEMRLDTLKWYMKNNMIEICPLSYIRGKTFSSCWIIADEMQNSTPMEMKTLLTRVGENTKIIVTGDLDQCDLPQSNSSGENEYSTPNNGLEDLIKKMRSVSNKNYTKYADIITFSENDVQRSDFVKHILKLYAK